MPDPKTATPPSIRNRRSSTRTRFGYVGPLSPGGRSGYDRRHPVRWPAETLTGDGLRRLFTATTANLLIGLGSCGVGLDTCFRPPEMMSSPPANGWLPLPPCPDGALYAGFSSTVPPKAAGTVLGAPESGDNRNALATARDASRFADRNGRPVQYIGHRPLRLLARTNGVPGQDIEGYAGSPAFFLATTGCLDIENRHLNDAAPSSSAIKRLAAQGTSPPSL